MSAAKDKGTRGESAVVAYLQARGFLDAERRALRGDNDAGDIAGIPDVCIEVKNCAELRLAEWVDEAFAEASNGEAEFGVVWHKRRRKVDPADWYVTMRGEDFASLLLLFERRGLVSR